MKLTTGKEIELKPLTIEQRITCEDAAEVVYRTDGSVVVRNAFRALVAWAEAGTGLTLEQLGKRFNNAELREIGAEVKRLSSLDPTDASS